MKFSSFVRKIAFIISFFISITVLSACNFNRGDQQTTPTPTTFPVETSVPTPRPSPLPQSWVRTSDEVAGYSIAHPPDWHVNKASRFSGESQITSFSPEEVKNPGPVPASELKVAVIRYLPTSALQPPEPSSNEIEQTETIVIAGQNAVRRIVEGISQSITITFSRDDENYLITAIPANSQHIDVFNHMISSFEFIPAISINQPSPQQTVSSPVTIEGSAPGTWFSEGQLSVRLITTNGRELARTSLTTDEDWMSEEAIPFSGEIKFSKPSNVQTAELVISKPNPSGLPENDKEVRLTIMLQ